MISEAAKEVIARMGSRPRKATEEELQELLAVGIAASNAELAQLKELEASAQRVIRRVMEEKAELEAELAELKAGSEAVAWIVTEHPTEFNDYTKKFRAVLDKPKCGTPLYTTPQPAPELKALRKDAERYRFLRCRTSAERIELVRHVYDVDMDEAIDALSARKGGE